MKRDESSSPPLTHRVAIAVLLAIIVFAVYLPSLRGDFVYDARIEILEEGYITNPANIPEVLSLKAMEKPIVLGSRPGQLLVMMFIAIVSGKHAIGYHLVSILLHVVNAALLFFLVLKLWEEEVPRLNKTSRLLCAWLAALLFACHPVAVESVSEISYSSTLLVAFFTMIVSLCALTAPRRGLLSLSVAGVMAVIAITCKESGITALMVLALIWLLYRRNRDRFIWMGVIGSASVLVGIFLILRFTLVPPSMDHPSPGYMGGSLVSALQMQIRLWAFMLGQIAWPVRLSADYQPVGYMTPSLGLSIMILLIYGIAQARIAFKSKMGALGVGLYWSSLASVSNIIPLYHPVADRYYYLALAGLILQALAVINLLPIPKRLLTGVAAVAIAMLVGFTVLTLSRQKVFQNEFNLWTDTLQKNPLSAVARNGLATAYLRHGQWNQAEEGFDKVLALNPKFAEGHNNLGIALIEEGKTGAALHEFAEALRLRPRYGDAAYNLRQAEAIVDRRRGMENLNH